MFPKLLVAGCLLAASTCLAETHSLTLQQTIDLAARQNPDVVLARLDAQRATEGIRIAQDPFRPKVYAGSGLAYTYGYPNSIEGNAPSLFQIRTDMSLYNRQQSYALASTREQAKGAAIGVQAKQEDVAYQAADLFLTASQLEHEGQSVSGQIPSLQKVVEAMTAAVSEGSELPLELQRAKVNLSLSQEQLSAARLDQDYYEMMLATVLGYPATDRVKPVDSETAASMTPPSQAEASDTALRNSKELRQIQSNVLAKQLDLRSYKAAHLPKIDLVAQYALFAKYNYEQYFQKFQRNNAQLGASVTIPILVGSAFKGESQQAYTDLAKLRIQADQVRNRIISDVTRSYEQWQKAEHIRNLARMQLDFSRQELTVLLAQNEEGRTPLREVEQARLDESNRWITLYDSEIQVTRAKLAIFRQMGTLLSSLRASSTTGRP
ncbi:MAG TPA: TolC family protein [Bryobacteraceae bacterium]|nr:TolC family protein [Bryobacteraceae bacterium]